MDTFEMKLSPEMAQHYTGKNAGWVTVEVLQREGDLILHRTLFDDIIDNPTEFYKYSITDTKSYKVVLRAKPLPVCKECLADLVKAGFTVVPKDEKEKSKMKYLVTKYVFEWDTFGIKLKDMGND